MRRVQFAQETNHRNLVVWGSGCLYPGGLNHSLEPKLTISEVRMVKGLSDRFTRKFGAPFFYLPSWNGCVVS